MSTPRRFLPSIASLRALEAVDRLGSASAAATELALTQSAISRQLQSLERQMGLEMVQRDGKRLSLTPAAAGYAAEIREALNRIAQAALRLQVDPAGGALNLAILPAFGMRWLMPRLPDFAKRHPDVTINMSTRLRMFSFAAEDFDAALHYGDGDWPDTDKMLLKHEQMLPVCAPGLLRDRRIRSASDLLELPLLHIQTRPRAWRDWLGAHDADPGGALPGTIYDQFATITQAALLGLGVALMPDYLVEQDLATGRLVRAWGGPTEAHGAYYLVWPRAKARLPALKQFRDWLAPQAELEDALPR